MVPPLVRDSRFTIASIHPAIHPAIPVTYVRAERHGRKIASLPERDAPRDLDRDFIDLRGPRYSGKGDERNEDAADSRHKSCIGI